MSKSKAVRAEKVTAVKLTDLPDGDYEGTWGGYIVKARIGRDELRFEMNDGIRTIGAHCVVSVRQGEVTVATKAAQ